MSSKPIDYELEEFYIGFKQSMINFYKRHSITRPIKAWSERLNTLQEKKSKIKTVGYLSLNRN